GASCKWHAHRSPALPGRRLEGAPRPHVIDDAAPSLSGPRPGIAVVTLYGTHFRFHRSSGSFRKDTRSTNAIRHRKEGLSRLALLDRCWTSVTTSTTIPTTVSAIPAPCPPAGRAKAPCRPGQKTMSLNGAARPPAPGRRRFRPSPRSLLSTQ